MAEYDYYVVSVSTKYLIGYMELTTNPVALSSFVQLGNQLHDSHGFAHVIRVTFSYYSCEDEIAVYHSHTTVFDCLQ